MTHLVLDLRFNPGGLMESAIDVADLFIADGLIVRIRDRRGAEQDRPAVPLGTFLDLQLLVLVNGESSSGSEIVAAAVQDAGRGTIVGSRSFGKGSIQEILALPDGQRGLKITSAIFLRPNGENLERFLGGRRPAGERWGVSPDPGWEMPPLSGRDRTLARFAASPAIRRCGCGISWPRSSPPSRFGENLVVEPCPSPSPRPPAGSK